MGLHFAEPQWVHLLWVVVAFLAVLGWLERRGHDALERFVSEPLRARLLTGPSRTQRVARLLFLGATGVFLTLALMRPQWGLELVESRRAGAEIMIALDVSRSMLAEDVAPNRLGRAKAEIGDLLTLLEGDQVGLIAFAGRATVLAPLTPDFGFLRIALGNASPGSVSRGGTRLEEPIRKAINGFGDAGEVSRSILLITDGEDHDSFPLEAAKAAAERGIRILAVGFGAEAGSEVPVTDPSTGARVLLRDADGAVVRSRLDGDLLREIALLTDGAYIPAGTGLLDLESIYQRHIAPLTRGRLDGQTRAVRKDAFQWALLLGLLALLGAVVSTARAAPPGHAAVLTSAAALAALLATLPQPADAQQTAAADAQKTAGVGGNGDTSQNLNSATADGAPAPAAERAAEIPDDPRSAYNLGLAKLEEGETEAATRLLENARSDAGSDGEVRFRATYNLGWAEVSAADGLIESAPSEALQRLHRAAAWFQEAVDLRPGDEDARYNLELVMRRALELADSIAAHDRENLEQSLNRLIEDQRGFLGALREGLAARQAAADANVTAELRRHFRALAGRELTVLADAEHVSDTAVRELEGLRAKPREEHSAEEALRTARLEAVVGHLHRARERMAQARVRLRRIQGARAYRRAAAAMGALQEARDQLLDPVARLDALLADGLELAQLTALKSAFERGIGSLEAPLQTPGWLTPAHLAATQADLETRTQALHAELASALAGTATGNASQAAQHERLVEQLQSATPLIAAAGDDFAAAATALEAADLARALDRQRQALEALAAARERFLDLRRLVDLAYREEQQVAALLTEAAGGAEGGGQDSESSAPSASASLSAPEALAHGAAIHARNVDRTVRLGEMLADAMVEALQAGEPGAAAGANPAGGRKALLEQAYELLRQAQDAMNEASQQLEQSQDATAPASQSDTHLQETVSKVEAALVHLEALRRLFFSVLEHLQDTARRQQVLADDTESLAALADPADAAETHSKAGPLGHRQERLAVTAEAIGETLQRQASAPPPQHDGPTPPQAVDNERLTRAAELVAAASATMDEAAAGLTQEAPAFEQARAAQDEALTALAEAIALLQQDQDGEQSDSQQPQPQTGERGGDRDEANQGADDKDLAQLLQGVRDREARRREEQAGKRAGRGYEPVEKDW